MDELTCIQNTMNVFTYKLVIVLRNVLLMIRTLSLAIAISYAVTWQNRSLPTSHGFTRIL